LELGEGVTALVPLKFRVYSGAKSDHEHSRHTLGQTTVTCVGGIILADDIPTATGGTALCDTAQPARRFSVPAG